MEWLTSYWNWVLSLFAKKSVITTGDKNIFQDGSYNQIFLGDTKNIEKPKLNNYHREILEILKSKSCFMAITSCMNEPDDLLIEEKNGGFRKKFNERDHKEYFNSVQDLVEWEFLKEIPKTRTQTNFELTSKGRRVDIS